MSRIFNIPVMIKKAVLNTTKIKGPITLNFKEKNVIITPNKTMGKNIIIALASLFYDDCGGEYTDQVDIHIGNQKVISNKNMCWLMYGYIDDTDKKTRLKEIAGFFKTKDQIIFTSLSEEGFEKYHKIYLKKWI